MRSPPRTSRRRRCRLLWLACAGLLPEARGTEPAELFEDAGPAQVRFVDYDCMRIPSDKQIVDWSGFYAALVAYLERKKAEHSVKTEMGGMELHFVPEVAALKQAVVSLPEGSLERRRAREQCPLGMLALCALEATALSSMHTEELEPKFRCIQELFASVPVFALAGAKWPVFRLLDQLWLLNKVDFRGLAGYANLNRFVQRQYADLTLLPEELAPFGAGRSVQWSSWFHAEEEGGTFTVPRIEELVTKSKAGYNGFGPTIRGLASALWESIQRDGATVGAHGRPVVRISLVFGREWAELMPIAWARWAALGLRAVVFAAMDEAAMEICHKFHLNCVPTGVPSILHKYSLATLALHLGIDVLYCDLDAVPLGPDPFGYIHAQRELQHPAPDLAVSTHNYDCLNAGVWFARASDETASFFLGLLRYLYEHWYEGDQRAFNALATGNVSVSFQAEALARLPSLRVVVLSPDVIAGTEGFADAAEVQLFHAYRLYGQEKLQLVRTLYGLPLLSGAAAASRAELWRWARDRDAKARTEAAARVALAPYARPRTSASCW